MSSITNEKENNLAKALKDILPCSNKMDALVGYFYFSGFQEIYKELDLSGDRFVKLKEGRVSQNSQQVEARTSLPKRLLEGIRVVDFTQFLAGPLATKYLSDYGAEVIKIESTTRLEGSRIVPPYKDGIPEPDRAGFFVHYNTGKLSVALNLTHPKGVEIAKRLVAGADIVAETFTGKAMERMGLGYEELKKIKPDIIMLSSCQCMKDSSIHERIKRSHNYPFALPGRFDVPGPGRGMFHISPVLQRTSSLHRSSTTLGFSGTFFRCDVFGSFRFAPSYWSISDAKALGNV